MEPIDGLLSAVILDGKGGGGQVSWPGVATWSADHGALWMHLDRKHENAVRWLRDESGLDELVCDALLAKDTRPRCTAVPGGVLMVFRGINLNPGAEPDDMISLRLWIDPHRVITLRAPKLMAVEDIRQQIYVGEGPVSTGQLVTNLVKALTQRIGPTLSQLDETIDAMEEASIDSLDGGNRFDLAAARRQAITLHRYVAPQREAVAQFASLASGLLSEEDRCLANEVSNLTTRYLEDLIALRERAALVQEEVLARQSERMNRTMYVLSLVTAIFLPLGLITGLLGINVGGLPGTDSSLAFLWVCLILAVLAVIEYLVLRWWRLL